MFGDFQGERKLRISAKMRKNGSTAGGCINLFKFVLQKSVISKEIEGVVWKIRCFRKICDFKESVFACSF